MFLGSLMQAVGILILEEICRFLSLAVKYTILLCLAYILSHWLIIGKIRQLLWRLKNYKSYLMNTKFIIEA